MNPASQRSGLLAAAGSITSAIAASACCWLPLLLIAFGASAGGVSAWFERYRLFFLIAAAVLLALGFYLVYRPQPECEPGSKCATPKNGLRRFNQVVIWVAAVLVVAFAAFPKYAGNLVAAMDDSVKRQPVSQTGQTVTLSIEGMTCETCAVTLKKKLQSTPGVAAALVDYGAGTATVILTSDAPATREALKDAVSSEGYSVVKSD